MKKYVDMQWLIEKTHMERYVSSRLVLTVDLLVSTLASVLAVLIVGHFVGQRPAVYVLFSLWAACACASAWLFFYLFKTYRAVIRHSTLREVAWLAMASVGKVVVLGGCSSLVPDMEMPFHRIVTVLSLDFLLTICSLVLLRVVMVMVYDVVRRQLKRTQTCRRVFVYGTDDKAVALAMRFKNSAHYYIEGFLTYGDIQKKVLLSDRKVFFFKSEQDYTYICDRYEVDAVLFATADAAREEQERLLRYLAESHRTALIAPPLNEMVDGHIVSKSVREIKIEDLLGRPEIKISMGEIVSEFRDKVVMVTGAAGSIGSELVRQLAGFEVKHIVLFDNAETPMHNLRLELEECFPRLQFTPIIGDVRLKRRLDYAFRTYHPQIVFHAAAYKHVPLMEENPCEAVLVNVVGSRNVADKCIEYDVDKMVMVSTDKAVNPTNIMGCTKRLAEIYVQSLGIAIEQERKQGKTKFVTTRFGNVLGSNGSVIPRFREQIAKGGPLTVTHPEITRFFMTIPEACRLVMEAATLTDGNQIFVFDMGESVKIAHLASRMIELAGLVPDKDIKIEYTGLRPGEKLYEEVLSSTENTLPTSHNRIRIAQVRKYNYDEAVAVVEQLDSLARNVEISEMVRLMKRTVPEYKSKNSVFEELD